MPIAAYRGEYARLRRELLRSVVPCQLCYEGCTGRSTSLDHQPPLALHRHVDGSGCCRLVPCCKHCNLKAGRWRVFHAARGHRVTQPVSARVLPRPSRNW